MQWSGQAVVGEGELTFGYVAADGVCSLSAIEISECQEIGKNVLIASSRKPIKPELNWWLYAADQLCHRFA